jgi:lysophospholipase L1-like esterase
MTPARETWGDKVDSPRPRRRAVVFASVRAIYHRSPPFLQSIARRLAPVLLRRNYSRTEPLTARYGRLGVRGAQAVVLGDSTVAMAPLLDLFTDLRNRGVSGETAAQVHARLPALLADQPEQLLVLAGANDLLRGRGVEATVASLAALLRDAASHRDATRIVALSVLPMRTALQRRIPPPGDIVAVNTAIRDLSTQLGLEYLDLHPPLVDEAGELRSEFTTDGVHLTALAYQAVSPLLLPYLG